MIYREEKNLLEYIYVYIKKNFQMIYREEKNLLEYIYVYIKKNFQSPKKRIFPKGVNPYF